MTDTSETRAKKISEAMRIIGSISTPKKAAASARNLNAYRETLPLKQCSCGQEPHKHPCPVYFRERKKKSRENVLTTSS